MLKRNLKIDPFSSLLTTWTHIGHICHQLRLIIFIPEKSTVSLPTIVEELEREYIIEALRKTKWHREKAAALLGITRKILGDRIVKYGLKKQQDIVNE